MYGSKVYCSLDRMVSYCKVNFPIRIVPHELSASEQINCIMIDSRTNKIGTSIHPKTDYIRRLRIFLPRLFSSKNKVKKNTKPKDRGRVRVCMRVPCGRRKKEGRPKMAFVFPIQSSDGLCEHPITEIRIV